MPAGPHDRSFHPLYTHGAAKYRADEVVAWVTTVQTRSGQQWLDFPPDQNPTLTDDLLHDAAHCFSCPGCPACRPRRAESA